MAWKNAGIVFRGGTQEAKSLAGKRARARQSLEMPIYVSDSKLKDDPGKLAIAALAEGVIGYVPIDRQDEIVIAFSATPGVKLTSLTQIGRIPITSVRVNWPTFRAFFDIDA